MIRYRLTLPDGELFISITVTDGNEFGEIQYSRDSAEVEAFKEELAVCAGAFGHLIGETTSPIDLDVALRIEPDMQQHQPELVEGAELVAKYDSDIPEGAMT